MGRSTRIDWADASWNPVTGCLHGCPYCYARCIAQRFGCKITGDIRESTSLVELDKPYISADGVTNPYPYEFIPTFHRYRLGIPQGWKTPKNIFVCSMADLFGDWVPERWIQEVFAACEAAPQHTYLFLTKNPRRLQAMYNARLVKKYNTEHPDKPHPQTEEFAKYTPLPEHDNWWLGSSVTTKESRFFQGGFSDHVFISIEPILEKLDVGLGSFGDAEWIIIGAETGNRKDKVKPEKAWIKNVEDAAAITSAAVFMKESLRELMGDELRQEFPWEVQS